MKVEFGKVKKAITRTNLVIEVPDHVYVFYAYRLYFADKDIYMIRYFYHKIEIIRFIASTDIFCSAFPRSAFRAHTC